MIEIRKVDSKKELKRFIHFPNELYKGSRQWVPALDFDEMETLRKDKNPAFEHCKAEYWLAYKDNKVVGRVAGIINFVANEKWGKKVRFGWIDFIDDPEVPKQLLSTVEQWGKENGMTEIQGPLGFNDMDKEGILVEGFENTPTISSIYNYEYYPKHIEKLGYEKAEDWLQYKIHIGDHVPEKIVRVNNLISNRYHLRTLSFTSKSELKKYAHPLFETLNVAFANLYGYSKLTDKEIQRIVNNYFTFIDPRFVSIVVDEKDHVIAFGISIPNLSEAFKKAKGKILPFGFIHLLKGLKNTNSIDLLLNGVHPDWQNKGIHTLYYTRLNQAYIDCGTEIAITNPQLETNTNAVHIWNNYDRELFMRRRCYIKKI